MITAVDTNVLVDVFRDDPAFCAASSAALRQCLQRGRVVACDVVWAELAALFPSASALRECLGTLGVTFSPIEAEAATLAGAMWRCYRDQGGSRDRVVADFLIAAHAKVQCEGLLTRDRGFYRTHFSGLQIFDPSLAR